MAKTYREQFDEALACETKAQANARLIADAPRLKDSHDSLVEALEAAEKALKEMAAWHGGTHEDDCSCDDTCECRHRPFNERVNNAINGAEAALRAAKEE